MNSEQARILEQLGRSFTPNRPIDLPEFLAGRINLLYKAQDAARTSGLHIILYGERGTGKTSIARVLAHILQEPDRKDGCRALLVSCDSTDDYSSIWRKVTQEILIAQRQLGFLQQDMANITGRLSLEEPINEPNTARLFVQSLPNPTVIIIDEFDHVPSSSNARQLMADTIKLFSDTNTKSTIILVGVAESITELIAEHESISRNIAQICVEPMTTEELAEIIQKGFERCSLKYEQGVDVRIADWSQGYPHYTHLLGLWSGRHAVQEERLEVTYTDLFAAITDALEYATGSVQQEYELAIRSSRKDAIYKDVLLACALAPKDPLGRFALTDVRDPLSSITGRNYTAGAYQGHLARFTEDKRGPVLKRTGHRRNYRWKFLNPHLITYVLLVGIKDGRWKMN